MLGLAEGCFNNTVQYTRERKQFGKRICDFQVRIHTCRKYYEYLEVTVIQIINKADKKVET